MPSTLPIGRRAKATQSRSALSNGWKDGAMVVRFEVTVNNVAFTAIDKKWQPEGLSVELKRRSKAQSTEARPLCPTEADGGMTVRWNQTLSISVNLRNSEKGGLESKECKLSLEEVKTHGSNRSLATCTIDLAQHFDCDIQPNSITVPLKPISSKIGSATLELTVESFSLKDGVKASDTISLGSQRTMNRGSLLDFDLSSSRFSVSNQQLAPDYSIYDDVSRTSIIVQPIISQEQLDELNEKNRLLTAANEELQEELEETKRQLALANEKHREQLLLVESKNVDSQKELEAAVQEIERVKAASEISEGVSASQLLRLKAEMSRDKAEWEVDNKNLLKRIEELSAEVAGVHQTMQKLKEDKSMAESKWKEERQQLEQKLSQLQTDTESSNRTIGQRRKSSSASGSHAKQVLRMGHMDVRLHPSDVLPSQSRDADMSEIVTELIGAKMERATLSLALEEALLSNKELHREMNNQRLFCMEYSRKIAEMEARANRSFF